MPEDNVSPTLDLAIRNFARSTKQAAVPQRYVTQVTSIADRKTTGMVTAGVGSVRVRNSVGIAINDWIIAEVDPRAQNQWVFVSFAKKPAGTAPAVPDVYTTVVESPPSEDLTVAASTGQTTTIGASGDPVVIAGDPDKTWPFDLRFLLFDSSGGECVEYTTLALAIAAAATGDTIFAPPGTHTCDALTLPDGVNLVGLDRDNTILTSSAQSTTLTVGNGCFVGNLTATNTRSANPTYAVYMSGDSAEFFNVKMATSNGVGAGGYTYGLYVLNGGTVKCHYCIIEGLMTGGGTGYGALISGSGTLEIHGGYVDSTTYDLYAGNTCTINVFGPVLNNGAVQIVGTGAINGIWYDSAGDFGAYTQGQMSINGTDRLQVDDEGVKSLSRIFEGVWYDYPLLDTTEGDQFRQNAATYPAGWTEVDAPAATNTDNIPSFWFIRGTSTDVSWDYNLQTGVTIESLAASAWASFLFGPFLFRDGTFTADVDYYFQICGNNAGVIDTAKYIRLHLQWSSAGSIWRVQAESDANDGGGQTASGWTTLTAGPIIQPLYFRIGIQNNAAKTTRVYWGSQYHYFFHSLVQQVNETTTWGQVWWRLNQTRGAGIDDYWSLGAVDYQAGIP